MWRNVPLIDGIDQRLDVGIAREKQAHAGGVIAAHLGQKLHARHFGHALVGHDDVHLLIGELFEPGPARSGAHHAVVEAQQVVHTADHVRLVVNHQKGVPSFFHVGLSALRLVARRSLKSATRGKRMRKHVPCPRVESLIEPPCPG